MIGRDDSVYYASDDGYVFRKRDAIGQRTFAPEQLFWKHRPVLTDGTEADLEKVVDKYLKNKAA